MAENIPFPPRARITDFDMHTIRPGEVVHESQFTTQVQPIFFDREVWRGRITIAKTGRNPVGLANMLEIDNWMDALQGVANYTDIPFKKPTFADDGVARRTLSSLQGGNLQFAAAGAGSYIAGLYFKFAGNGRVFRIKRIFGDRLFTTTPPVNAAAMTNTGIERVETIRVRRAHANEIPLVQTPDFGGEQLVFDWTEWID